jgi:hypothetical protein
LETIKGIQQEPYITNFRIFRCHSTEALMRLTTARQSHNIAMKLRSIALTGSMNAQNMINLTWGST